MFDEAPADAEVLPFDSSPLEPAPNDPDHLARRLAGLPASERLGVLCDTIAGRVVLTLGFGIEGQLLFHWIATQNLAIDVVTLDTGRLFPETYALWAATERRYGRRIRAITPQAPALEAMIDTHGINGFHDSRDARTACCDVRKVRPLDRALAGASAWISGLRADQSEARRYAAMVARDHDRGLIKVNPLIDWTRERVLAEVAAHDIPVNALHAQGFVSVGCAPCTRAVPPGGSERDGRWWWEENGHRECGLHLRRKPAA